MDDRISSLVDFEIKSSVDKYGPPADMQEHAYLVAKEAVEVVDGTMKKPVDDYRIWAITHNIIQTMAACVKYLNYLEKNHGLNLESYDMEKP